MSSISSEFRPERSDKAEYYVIREIWVDGDFVVIDVQGVRDDGSYWVTGFQIRVTKVDWDRMNESDILDLVMSEARKNEAALDEAYLKMRDDESKTASLRNEVKYKNLVGQRIVLGE